MSAKAAFVVNRMKTQPPRRGQKPTLAQQHETATNLAIGAFGFIASEPEELDRFLSLTGIGPESIREAAGEPGFLLGVLEFLANDVRLLVAFANQSSLAPEDVGHARAVLAGET
jgi:hypothetical protein